MEEFTEKASILIVDDRSDKLLAMQTMLDGLDENLVCVRSGNEALRQLLKQDFAVILLDVNMPDMDGFETAALIRKRQRSETTPIIFISAVNDAETHVSQGYSLGAVDYILTPVIPEILRAKIAVFVDLFRKTEKVKRQAEEHTRFVQEQAARVEAEAARERLAFLAEAGRVLSGSLDQDQIFENLSSMIVPAFSDFCWIHRVDEAGLLQPSGAGEDEGLTMAARVLDAKRPELRNNIDAVTIGELFPNEDWEGLKPDGVYHSLAVPIATRDSIMGIVSMVRTDAANPYTAAQLSLAEELAQRAALALENASLFLAAHRARDEAEAANKAKDRFLAMLSHELRTPLTPVITSILNLEADETLGEDTRKALLVMRRNVELEARLIDDLLDLTRVGTGQIHLGREVVNAHSLLQNALEICRPDIEAKSLSLNVHLQATEIFVEGDPARLQQIFWNLIRNATKFTNTGGIRVSTRSDNGRFHIEVSDTGAGMEPELLNRIFLPFEQGERGLFGGLGLGLTITKALVDLHEGQIQVNSAGKYQGATFLLDFPLSAAPVTQALDCTVPPAANHAVPLRILLVEDHVDTNEALRMLLEMRGYSVLSALNVKSALELAAVNEIDVLISDLGLPDGNAGEAMALVATRYAAPGIALSGYGMEEDQKRSREYGFRYHLVKPVDVTRLDSILRQLGVEAA